MDGIKSSTRRVLFTKIAAAVAKIGPRKRVCFSKRLIRFGESKMDSWGTLNTVSDSFDGADLWDDNDFKH